MTHHREPLVTIPCPSGPTLEIRPVFPTFGAAVRGVDLSQPLPDDVFAAIERAFTTYSLLLFPEQRLEPAHEVGFLQRFNAIADTDYSQRNGVPGFPQIAVLSNIVGDDGEPLGYTNRKGMEWHTDGSGWLQPPVASSLYALEVPDTGGETWFASGYVAYESLPAELRARVDGAQATYSYVTLQRWLAEAGGRSDVLTEEEQRRYPDVVRPLVRVHPVTGRRALFFSIEEIVDVDGMGYEASRELLLELVRHLESDPHAVFAHHWDVGDLVVWDNRCLLHSVCEYNYEGQRRLMHQITGKDLAFAV